MKKLKRLLILFGVCTLMIISGCAPKDNTAVIVEESDTEISIVEIESNLAPANSLEELIVYADLGKSIGQLKLQEKDDIFYLFLPAATRTFSFANASGNSYLEIAGKEIGKKTIDLSQNDWLLAENSFSYSFENYSGQGIIRILKSENIPSVFVNTEASLEELNAIKGVEYPGSIQIIRADGANDYSGPLEHIRTRGNTSFSYDKKPYQIKLEKKYSVLGMPRAKKWILLANEDDNTYMWNSFVLGYANEHSTVPASQGQFVDLYINNEYRGNYFLCQKVDVNTGLVDLTDLEELNEKAKKDKDAEYGWDETHTARGLINSKSPKDITGGYLLEYGVDYQADLENSSYIVDGSNILTIKFPENATLDEVLYIKKLIEEIRAAIGAPNGINPDTGKHYSEYIDVDSFAEKYLIESVFADLDCDCSIFFYKDADVIDSKLYAGPCWDYDKAFFIDRSVTEWFSYGNTYLIKDLLKQPDFLKLCMEKYEKSYKPYIKYQFPRDLFAQYTMIEESLKMNDALWGTPKLRESYQAFLDTIIYRANDRLKAIEEGTFGIGNAHKVVFDGKNMMSISYRLIEDGKTIENIPIPSSYFGLFIGWYRTDNGEKLYFDTPIYDDVTYEARYLDISTLILNGEAIAGVDVEKLSPEQFEYIAEYIRNQQKEQKENK